MGPRRASKGKQVTAGRTEFVLHRKEPSGVCRSESWKPLCDVWFYRCLEALRGCCKRCSRPAWASFYSLFSCYVSASGNRISPLSEKAHSSTRTELGTQELTKRNSFCFSVEALQWIMESRPRANKRTEAENLKIPRLQPVSCILTSNLARRET